MLEMLHAFIDGLFLVLSWNTVSLMLVGIAIGFAVGILPGLGGPVTLALMLPFVFKMNGVEAFAFLLGMSAVTATTGDITSILFGVPGEAITASTIIVTRNILGRILEDNSQRELGRERTMTMILGNRTAAIRWRKRAKRAGRSARR